MAAFRFRLERVLAWRRTSLSLEQARLENLRGQLRTLETARQELIDRRGRAQREVAASPESRGRDLARLEDLRVWSAREEMTLAARTASLHGAISAQSARVVDADREARLVERLKERRRETWFAGEQRSIEETAGESAVAQWRRKNTSDVR